MHVSFDRITVQGPFQPVESELELKEWVWKNCKESIISAMSIDDHSKFEQEQSKPDVAARRLELLDSIAQVQQRQYRHMEQPKVIFDCLLRGILDLMDSEYGFVGEFKSEKDGTPYVQTHAATNIAWNAETQAFYEQNVDAGLKFYNMNSLFGNVVMNARPVISNNPKNDKRACGIPKGHPPLNYFLGVPIFKQGGSNILGMIGIANKPGGYSQADVEILEPIAVTCSNLIQAYGAVRENKYLIDTLEEKVANRTRELMVANAQLEEANQRVVETAATQLEHFACMSHEIRTPLNCIIGLSSLLEETELTAQQRDSMQMIVTSGKLLHTVVNDVLDYSKLVSGKVDINIIPTSLQETLDAVVHSIELKASERNIVLRTYYNALLPETVNTDNRRLQQILFNLMGNAIKFSKDGGNVDFSVLVVDVNSDDMEESDDGESDINEDAIPLEEATRCPFGNRSKKTDEMGGCPFQRPYWKSPSFKCGKGADMTGESKHCPPDCANEQCPSRNETIKVPKRAKMLRFVVKDYGKGIDKADFGKIFQPFLQASSETERLYGGTGLGLAITSRLVTALGGTISVDSILGKWSEFTFEIPVDDVADIKSISEKLKKARIVLVNDDDNQNPPCQCLHAYNASVVKLNTCNGLGMLSSVQRAVDPSLSYIVVVKEDLFQSNAYERFKAVAKNAVLLTFGPEYRVKEADGHYRSLVRILPSVLMRSFASYIAPSMNANQVAQKIAETSKRKTISRREIRVLIAEDNVINQKVLKRMLTRLSLEFIDVVGNGLKAVEASARRRYDIVFMDMQMPVMGGLEATRRIIERDGRRCPKIVFVTANAAEPFETKVREVGAHGFVSKPFTVQKIETCLEALNASLDVSTHSIAA